MHTKPGTLENTKDYEKAKPTIADIIVYNGIICRYSHIKEFIHESEPMRLAYPEEIALYALKNKLNV